MLVRKYVSEYRIFRRMLLIGVATHTLPLAAQGLPPGAPPIREISDENGVDMGTGHFLLRDSEISIGSSDDGGMTFTRVRDSDKWHHPFYMYVSEDYYLSPKVTLVLGTASKVFALSSGSYLPDDGDGSTLIASGSYNSTWTYTASDGTIIIFSRPTVEDLPFATSLTKPSGERYEFHYKGQVGYLYLPEFDLTIEQRVNRPQSVTSNYGYHLKLSYASNSTANADETEDFLRVTSATLLNSAVEYCSPNADSCSGLTQIWPKLSYDRTVNGAGSVETTTNLLGQITEYAFDIYGRAVGVRRPGSLSNDISISYQFNAYDNTVSSVNKYGRVVDYNSYNIQYTYNTMRTASQNGSVLRTVVVGSQYDDNDNLILSDTDALNRTVVYQYDVKKRPTQITYPEGNYNQFVYDARGNVTQVSQVAKPGSNLDSLVWTQGFDATCISPAKCNKPNWSRDPLNNQTDYSYDGLTGQPLTITLPAPFPGSARPQTRYTYAPKYAWTKGSSGALLQQATPIKVLTETSRCLAGSSCTGTADEQRIAVAHQVGSASAPSNILPISTTISSGDSALSATTAVSYDQVGNVVAVDGPAAGPGDMVGMRYDALRRSVGVIAADPDGVGSLPNSATRVTYDPKGRVILNEQGTTAGQTDTAWTNFTPAASVAATYDDADRRLTETLKSGSTAYGLTQYSYDGRGRPDCVTIRMNPVTYGALPDACSLATEGTAGKDRIVKFTYDAAGQLTQRQSGYGTLAMASEATGYTLNGRVAHVVDANNNRTSYEYDGHDRLVKTSYPTATLGANASSSTDYEQSTYGDNVHRTSVRLRDGSSIALGYDNLGRLTSRAPAGEPTVNTSYNLLGMVTAVHRPADGVNLTFGYNALGLRTSESQPFGSASYIYDAAGRLTRLTWGDGFYASYEYDAAGRVLAIRENGAAAGVGVLATYSYDALGRRHMVAYGNGTSRTYSWDPVSRLSGLKIDLAGSTSDQVIGQIGGIGSAIGYNPASQMTTVARTNDAYAYTGRYNVFRTHTVNGLNQYTAAGGVGFGYDQRGNLTSSGTSSYAYSKLNEMTAAPGIAMAYDGQGRLIQYSAGGSITRFAYAGPNLIAEFSAGGSLLRRYVPGPGTDEPIVWYEGSGTSDRRFLQADERGSIVALTDASGNALAINRYDEYGIPQSTNLGRFQYTGQTWYPELGMYNYKARIYSPTLGRFLQTDPIGYADGLNWYNYVGADPVNGVDPTGKDGDIIVPGNRPKPITPEQGSITLDMDAPEWELPWWHAEMTDLVRDITKERGWKRRKPQNDQPQPCPIAWTPQGDTKGENPTLGSGGYKTDLPGDLLDAGAVFVGLRRLAGDTGTSSPFLRPDILMRSEPSGIQLRIGLDRRPRIDIPANTFTLRTPETIHFTGGKGNMCPTR